MDMIQRMQGELRQEFDLAARVTLAALKGRPKECPSDLAASHGEIAGKAEFRSMMLRFGRLLESWVAIIEASRELKQHGSAITVGL